VRIALVSPYSWTYPGGVTRHIEALTAQFLDGGHDVRVLAPFDPPDRRSARMHRGARPQERETPDWLIPLGRTIGFPANGAISNLSLSPTALMQMRRELKTGGYDVIHVHEPVAPLLAWDVLCSSQLPLVGTFHCYSANRFSNNAASLIGARRRLNRLHVRIAVSEAAAWTGLRFYGGHYRIVPNGVDLPAEVPVLREDDDPSLRIVFIGQAVARKGLPVLLRAFEALRDHVPAKLTLIGAERADVEALVVDDRGIEVLGKVSDAAKQQALAAADVLCAPSLGGESFGMVLTEAFAQGKPVVASAIPGYTDVVRDGVDGVLVPRGDVTALAQALLDLAYDPARRARLAESAALRAQRYAWPQVAREVLNSYEDAIATPAPATAVRRAAVKVGVLPADGRPRNPARRLASIEPPKPKPERPVRATLRKAAIPLAALGGIGLSALALQHIGIDKIGNTLLASSPAWVLVALALMCFSMVLRALGWHAILRAALPGVKVRRRDAFQGTCIGVLMSATLPARLGEPSRALIVSRRLGRAKERFPVVLGTLISQTLLNLVALLILGSVMFATVHYFDGHHTALFFFAATPLVLLLLVLAAPALLRSGLPSRSRRVALFLRKTRNALTSVRAGLRVFRNPRLAAAATVAQLSAWGIQWLSCYVLLVALGLNHEAGIGAAAAVLFVVNVTAVLPATPSNLGVFQAACVAVLTGAYGVSSADALGYGIILQAVEIATAFIMGVPALLAEGLSWGDVRMRALHSTPVELKAPARRDESARVKA
jgi:phosphatidyl-myo-inositol alpha-mannosyltransferase